MTPIDRQAAFSGTKDVSSGLRIDTDRLAAHLAEHIAGFVPPLAARQFRGGQSNPTYLIDTPIRRYVLRRKPPGKLLPSAHAVDREFRVLQALHAQGFPVATPLHYCHDEDIIGTAFYVMGFVDGHVFWEPHMPGAAAPERAAVYDAMNGTIARLHGYDPAAIGLADFGRGENYVSRQIERWSRQYRASQTETIDDMERLIAWLPQNLPPPAPVRLVHGDYRLDNIIIADDRIDILAVLDWELATLGDPLADFSYHLMQWFMPPSETAGSGTLVRPRHRRAGHSLRRGLRGPLCGAHRARSASAPARLPRLQFLPPGGHLPGHRRPRARRHRDQRARLCGSAPDPRTRPARLGLRVRGGRMKSFALALGAGGARGLAHIAVFEALDELGVRPTAIAGSSIGALVGALYASGMSGKAIRRHTLDLALNRTEVFRRLRGRAHRLLVASPDLRQSGSARCRQVLQRLPARRHRGGVFRPEHPADPHRRRPPCPQRSGVLGRPAQARHRGLDGYPRSRSAAAS